MITVVILDTVPVMFVNKKRIYTGKINKMYKCKMFIIYVEDEFKPETNIRRVLLFEDSGDAVMTDDLMYEDEIELEEDEDEEIVQDGPDDG